VFVVTVDDRLGRAAFPNLPVATVKFQIPPTSRSLLSCDAQWRGMQNKA